MWKRWREKLKKRLLLKCYDMTRMDLGAIAWKLSFA